MSDKLFRKLSSVFLISSAAFAKAKPVEQTAAMTQNEGLPVLFVPDFESLRNKRRIRDNLLAGKDVSMELEFNDISLSSEERDVLSKVTPILEKITGITGDYPWLEGNVPESARLIKYGASSVRNPQGYQIGLKAAKKVWEQASLKWSGGEVQPFTANTGYEKRRVEVTADGVKIGCQTMSRAAVEAFAKEMNWEPNLG